MTERQTGPNRARGLYDRISRAYDLIADSSEHATRDLGVQALGVSRGQRVLEIGCGTGHGPRGPGRRRRRRRTCPWGRPLLGMMAVARRRVQSAALRNVPLTIGDARVLCFRSSVFDAVFMSFTLELFEQAIPNVLVEVRRVLRMGGRVGIVAMAGSGQTNAMLNLYECLHRRWPHFIDCRPIDVVGILQKAHFHARTAHVTAIWGLPVIAAIGVKTSDA